jgi:hypothetical protein
LERPRYNSSDDQSRYRTHSGGSDGQRQPVADEPRRRKPSVSEEPRRKLSPSSEIRTRRSSLTDDPGSRPAPEPPRAGDARSKAAKVTPQKRDSLDESDLKAESDSDALVIDIDDDDDDIKGPQEVDAIEARLAEITGEKPKPQKRCGTVVTIRVA